MGRNFYRTNSKQGYGLHSSRRYLYIEYSVNIPLGNKKLEGLPVV